MDEQKEGSQALEQKAFSRFQFTTVDIFWLTGFVSVLAFAIAEFGVNFVPLYIALVAFLIVTLSFVHNGCKNPPYGALGSLIPWVVIGFCAAMLARGIPFVLGAFVVAGLAICLVDRKWHTRRNLFRVSMVCMSAALLAWVFIIPPRLQTIYTLRNEYPLIDISSRLKYESENAQTTDEEKPVRSREVMSKLDENEVQDYRPGRTRQLQQVHSRTYENFIRANGFGAVRMLGVRSSAIHTPEIPSIKPAEIPDDLVDEDEDYMDDVDSWANVLFGDHRPLTVPSTYVSELHEKGVHDFVDPATTGYISSKTEVAGFLPHAFHFHPGEVADSHNTSDEKSESPPNQKSKWTMEQLQLISLLRFSEPRAYLTDELPRMDRLSSEDFPTRELTKFEYDNLSTLDTEQDVVIDRLPDEIKMIGSIRAKTSCLECHSVNRGDLLGAFSYRFRKNTAK